MTRTTWLERCYGIAAHELPILTERLKACESCRHKRGPTCSILGSMMRQIDALRRGPCPWYTEALTSGDDPYMICRTCTYARPLRKCAIFSAGCDAESRRRAALATGTCRYYTEHARIHHRYVGSHIPPDRFIATADLVDDAMELGRHIPWKLFSGIIAVARSGLIPAAILATHYHVPLWAISPIAGNLTTVGSGHRLGDPGRPPAGRLHVMDDTASNGGTMRQILSHLTRVINARDLYSAVVYATPQAADAIDFVGRIYPKPHYLDWNWQNTFWAKALAYDFDGILCDEPPGYDDDPSYRDFLENARPLYLPKLYPAVIVSARCEWTRPHSIAWLDRHGVSIRRLILWPGDPDDRWKTPDTVARWKADELRKLSRQGIHVFAESDPRLAEAIAAEADMPVICPAARRIFNQEKHRYERTT